MEQMDSVEACIDAILARLGQDIRVGTPLGIGKPNHLLNALYRRAKQNPDLQLTLYTALTLERPKGKSELERRFLEPMVERVFGNYPDLQYELDRVSGELPDNVRVREFYFQAGKHMAHAGAQRDYISTNYTYVARDLTERGVNLLLQQVAFEEHDGEPRVSLSCNPDVALDLMEQLSGRDDVMFVAQTNGELPFMYGDAVVSPDAFDILVHDPELDFQLFCPPKMSVSDADTMIGLFASTLIKDGGELQIGIGALGDALVYSLCLRHQDNPRYREVLEALEVESRAGEVIARRGALAPFDQGLFAATEMLVDSFQHLWEAGILKRRVYDDLVLQRLLNEGLIDETVTPDMLTLLRQRRAVGDVLNADDVSYLQRFGVLRDDLCHDGDGVVLADGTRLSGNLLDPEAFSELCEKALGKQLQTGACIHAGFFLGPASFYRWLREMAPEDRKRINMRSVTRVNQLYGHEALDRLHRTNARFVNTAMMVTLSGAVVSDGLEDGRVVSGVGGQYNFVAMAHALPDGHSVIQIRSTRREDGELVSNIVPRYGHTTIARHQRDIVITEYGVADLRGKTDEEVIQALLNIADSRFQDDLLDAAKASGKLSPEYDIPRQHRNNLPDAYAPVLARYREQGLFPTFPFGTDLTEQEIVLGAALKRLKAKTGTTAGTLEALGDAVIEGSLHEQLRPYLERMGLDEPETFKEKLYQRLLAAELRHDPRVGREG